MDFRVYISEILFFGGETAQHLQSLAGARSYTGFLRGANV
jgi:hypothetical protein